MSSHGERKSGSQRLHHGATGTQRCEMGDRRGAIPMGDEGLRAVTEGSEGIKCGRGAVVHLAQGRWRTTKRWSCCDPACWCSGLRETPCRWKQPHICWNSHQGSALRYTRRQARPGAQPRQQAERWDGSTQSSTAQHKAGVFRDQGSSDSTSTVPTAAQHLNSLCGREIETSFKATLPRETILRAAFIHHL